MLDREKLDDACKEMRGCNYIPSYAGNSVQMWLHYDTSVIRRELDLAGSIGLNTVRVFLQSAVYESDPRGFLKAVDDFFEAAEERDLSVVPCLFDGCFGQTPSVENDGIPLDSTIPNYPWVACPGLENVRSEFYPRGERYVQSVIATVGQRRNLFLWDVMNEPFSCGNPEIQNTLDCHTPFAVAARRRIVDFCDHFSGALKDLGDGHAQTIGATDVTKLYYFEPMVDVLSFHEYWPDPEGFEPLVRRALQKAEKAGKPLVLTECGAMGQKMSMVLPICSRYGIGWCFTWLMIAQVFTEEAGLFFPNGSPRDSDELIAIKQACGV